MTYETSIVVFSVLFALAGAGVSFKMFSAEKLNGSEIHFACLISVLCMLAGGLMGIIWPIAVAGAIVYGVVYGAWYYLRRRWIKRKIAADQPMSNAFSAKLVKFLNTLDRLRQARGAGLEPMVQMDLRERLEELLEQLSDAEQKIAEANAWRSHPDQFRERLYREAKDSVMMRPIATTQECNMEYVRKMAYPVFGKLDETWPRADVEIACEGWYKFIDVALEFFPGYSLDGFDPNIKLSIRRTQSDGSERVMDTITITPHSIEALCKATGRKVK